MDSLSELITIIRAELDAMNKQIEDVRNESLDFKPSVSRYNDLKMRESELRKARANKVKFLGTLVEQIKTMNGGIVPESIYPLFSQPKEEAKHEHATC